jgi:hypothetical protein
MNSRRTKQHIRKALDTQADSLACKRSVFC